MNIPCCVKCGTYFQAMLVLDLMKMPNLMDNSATLHAVVLCLLHITVLLRQLIPLPPSDSGDVEFIMLIKVYAIIDQCCTARE